MQRIVVYKRVSTDKQDTESQNLAIARFIQDKYPNSQVTEYVDEGYSGKSTKRPAFQRLVTAAENKEVDLVVVFRLDRLSRSSIDMMKLLINWIQNDIEFVAVDQPTYHLVKENPFRLTMLSMLADLAQIERDAISSRTKAGLAAARQRGVRLGAKEKFTEKQREQARTLKSQGMTYRDVAKKLKMSVATVHSFVHS